MFKAGLMRIGEERYYVYEVSNAKYYRLDICKEGTKFHVEPEGILYSVFRRKKEFVYGDPLYREKFEDIKRTIGDNKADTVPDSKWSNGQFITVYTKTDEAARLKSEITKANNIIVQEIYMVEDKLLSLKAGKDIADMVMEPLNANQYVSAQIEKSYTTQALFNDLSVLKSRFNLNHILVRDYKVVDTIEEGRGLLTEIRTAYLRKDGGKIGGDFETSGVDMNYFGKDYVTGVVVRIGKHYVRYFPFAHEEFDNLPMEFFYELMQCLIDVQDFSVGHNIKFEHKVAYKYGLDWCIKHDSYKASIVNDPRVIRGIHELKTLESEIDNQKYLSLKPDIFIGEVAFQKLPKDLVAVYACPDGDGTVDVLENELKKMEGKNQEGLYELECEIANLKAEQEYWGFRIDHEKFIEGLDNCEFVVNELEKLIRQLAGKSDFNINSGDQVANHLYNELHCPIVARTKSGKAGTGKNAIVKLSKIKREENDKVIKAISDFVDKEGHTIVSAKELNEARYPITILLLAYKKQVKLLTGFYNRLLNSSQAQFKVTVQNDGRRKVQYTDLEGRNCVRFFFWINENGTESGRQSSTIHTMPPAIKNFFLPDSEEHELVDADYCQVELRVLPSLAREPELMEWCADPDNDIHRVIGALISGKEMWEISEEERKSGKSRNFGVVYLISANGLAEQMHGAMPSKKQVADCNVSILEFYDRFKKIRAYLDQNAWDIENKHEIFTMWNRVRRFPQMADPTIDKQKRASLVRQGNNMPVQGTAADIMKLAEVKYYKYIKKKGWNKLVKTPQGEYPLVRVMVSIHDEVIISRHKSIPIEEILEMQRTCQEINIKDFAPLFANPAIISNWGEGKEDHFEIPKGLRDKLIEDYQKTGKSVFPANTLVKDAMADMIKEFKSTEIIEYMEGLIQEWGTDPEVLASKVRHNRLTHELISTHKSKKHKELSHLERISFAVKDYLEHRGDVEFYKTVEVTSEDKIDDATIIESIKGITGFIESIKNVDALGEVVDDPDEEIDEDIETLEDESEEEFIKRISYGRKYMWSHRTSFNLDGSTLTVQECDKVLDFIEDNYGSEEGMFPVYLYYAKKTMDTKIRTDKLDVKEVDKFVEDLKKLRGDSVLFNGDKKKDYKG